LQLAVGDGITGYPGGLTPASKLLPSKCCYRDYQWWLTVRATGGNYVDPEYREAAGFGE